MGKILVIGSSNTDMVVKTGHFPVPGETVLGGQFFMFPGGKGANQAVAAARLGGTVTFLTKLGQDMFGDKSLAGFELADIDTRYVLRDELVPSGIALITIDDKGQNTIVVAPGANQTLSWKDIDTTATAFAEADMVLMQLEIPVDTIAYAADKAYRLGKSIILNPAPAQAIPNHLWKKLFLVTPNETEAQFYTGITVHDETSAKLAAKAILSKGVQHVIITMGARGALFMSNSEEIMVPSPPVQAVDTTAAGDVFNGALCVGLGLDMPWKGALELACRAAAFSVTRMGAQASAPMWEDLERFRVQ